MFRGRYRQGQHVPFTIVTRDSAGTPGEPDDAPHARVFKPNGTICKKFNLPVANPNVAEGVFAGKLRLESEFDTLGVYSVMWYYTVDSDAIVEEDTFEVLAGGNMQGSVISLHYFSRPWAAFMVQQLDSGVLVANRNPRI